MARNESTKSPNRPNGDNNKSRMSKSRPKLHRAYHDAADVLAGLDKKTGSINSLMNRFTGDKCIKMIYALAVKVVKNQDTIREIMDQLPFETDNLNPTLVEILIAELLYGEKSFLKYRIKNEIKYVLDHRKTIENLAGKLRNKSKKIDGRKQQNHLVRYVRVNLIKTTKEEVEKKLKFMGYEQESLPKKKRTFEEFKTLARQLKPQQFMNDYHFDDVLVFNDEASKPLTESPLWLDGWIVMQDKASLLALEAMNLRPGMTILDACAAPGMKTAAIASRLKNQCTLYANDQNPKRFQEMKAILNKNGVKFKSVTLDFTQMDPEKYPDLDVLLLDPSCSGSGIYRRLDYKAKQNGDHGQQEQEDKERCTKLAKFQLKMLQCALAFRAKRIVYSTCSKYMEENEDVIHRLLEMNPDMEYRVVDPWPEWPMRGQGDYPFSKQCLRADFETTLTNGFFCCTLERLDPVTETPIKCKKFRRMEAEPPKTKAKDQSVSAAAQPKRKRTQGRNYFFVTPL